MYTQYFEKVCYIPLGVENNEATKANWLLRNVQKVLHACGDRLLLQEMH